MYNTFVYNAITYNAAAAALARLLMSRPIFLDIEVDTVMLDMNGHEVTLAEAAEHIYLDNSQDQPTTLSNDARDVFL